MKFSTIFPAGAALLAIGLTACGGGGSGSPTATPQAGVGIQSLAAAPANFDYANYTQVKLSSSDVTAGLSFTQPALTYVSICYVAGDGSCQTLAFLKLSTMQALDGTGGYPLTVLHGATIRFETYSQAAGSYQTTGIKEIKA